MRTLPAPPVITPFSPLCVGLEHRASSSGVVANTAWPAARRIFYVPMYLPMPIVVRRLFWVNGATVSGNVDVGIYSAVDGLPATRLTNTGASGTAMSGASVLQSVDITDIALGPGSYFLAMMVDNATATMWRSVGGAGATSFKSWGICGETPGSGSALPTTATPVTLASNYLPLFGLTTVALI